jgi:hypothetical protein
LIKFIEVKIISFGIGIRVIFDGLKYDNSFDYLKNGAIVLFCYTCKYVAG